MTAPTIQTTSRPDVDILADIHTLIARYPPLKYDRHRITVTVEGGAVQVAGIVKSPVTYKLLCDHLVNIAGVQAVDTSRLFHDEAIRLQISKLGLLGVFVNVDYGTVKLTGKLPSGMTLEALVDKISEIKGVQRVVAALQ